jgi:hypothetical protein
MSFRPPRQLKGFAGNALRGKIKHRVLSANNLFAMQLTGSYPERNWKMRTVSSIKMKISFRKENHKRIWLVFHRHGCNRRNF